MPTGASHLLTYGGGVSQGRAEQIRIDAASGASALVAGVFAIASLLVVFDFQIGPVVLVISQRHGHGVHLGDLLIGVPFGVVALGVGLVALVGHHRIRDLLTR